MRRLHCSIDILSYWHAGSGQSGGASVDSLALRDQNGLPYLPGKSLKGLFREAVQVLEEHIPDTSGQTIRLFGSRDTRREGTQFGLLRFEDARLPDDFDRWLSAPDEPARQELFEYISATALSEHGIALQKSLRSIEVALPMTLKAVISGPVNENWPVILQKAAPLIRSVGAHRHRGLGRCCVAIQGGQA
ncbi:MAG TPA: RAMP superfamily CRISPR-associated protein [Kiritimatiellia bacterium]|nr:RAMP superfamily CRISPR-associated protein [Kiritimatiellia bacterium]HMO98493.1 RAMP superfamily CRISPR-associated protein [Kiritimatiellia bacterium]HMP95801.1 RAMP superfamily CRISPR-associated protein [Kiritimatiellia bacterium]